MSNHLRIRPPFVDSVSAPVIAMSLLRSSRVLVTTLTLSLLVAGCGAGGRATYPNLAGSYTLYALTGAPVNAPTALSFLGGPTIASADFAFDVAVDINQAGDARLIPARTLAGGLARTPQRVGLQIVPGSFESLREAPKTGYDTLASRIVTAGTVVAVEIQDLGTCQYSLGGTNIYAKLVVDSIQHESRRIFGRTVVDANCGFRELMPDSIPSR